MSASRQQRRAAERQARKNLRKQKKAGFGPTNSFTTPPTESPAAPQPFFPDVDTDLATLEANIDQYERDREAEIRRAEELAAQILAERQTRRAATNRANTQHSIGSRTETGKVVSSGQAGGCGIKGKARSTDLAGPCESVVRGSMEEQNSFKHGISSNKLILPGEDPAELEHLKAGLMKQHQPGNLTVYLLVMELADHFWRMHRFRRIEANLMSQEELHIPHLTAVQRFMNSAERSFYKALKNLRELQKQRGFVPQNANQPESQTVVEAHASHAPSFHGGFVQPNTAPKSFRPDDLAAHVSKRFSNW